MPPSISTVSLLVLSLLGMGCGGESGMTGETSATSGSAPSSPAGAWILDADGTDASCDGGFTGGSSPVTSASLAVDDGMAMLSVEPCINAQDGEVTEGEAGFIANLANEAGEMATLTCQGDGPDAYTCEHSWLEGQLRLERL
ncbi:MAG: hypothetical protein K0V04_06810 [Deltaproteobacteria bacterium]|nr:hypothetical protein [Deltaproteobacteria bacterium]